MSDQTWEIVNPDGVFRVVVTKSLPGERWKEVLASAGCRIEIGMSREASTGIQIRSAVGRRCDGVIGQLTETWDAELFSALASAKGRAYSNYAVGYNNLDVDAATGFRIPVGNTPGVLTETTAEMAVGLTFAASRRIGEAERFVRNGLFSGWLPDLFLGELLHRKTLGVIGAGRIGGAYARMMVEGFKMNIIYWNPGPKPGLEDRMEKYSRFLVSQGERPVSCRRAGHLGDLLEQSDCVSIHTVLDDTTRHLIDAERLALMKENAILVNTSRGPVVDESALVAHCRQHPQFRAGLDVYEEEPTLAPGLRELENVVIVPHIASATRWTREGMAVLAAANVAAMLHGYPVWPHPDVLPFLGENPPHAAPSILNAQALGLAHWTDPK